MINSKQFVYFGICVFVFSMLTIQATTAPLAVGDCFNLGSTFCCRETPGYCDDFPGCGQCCGNDSISTPFDKIVPVTFSGWSDTDDFDVETSEIKCVFLPPLCVLGACTFGPSPETKFCVGFIEPGIPTDSLGAQ